MRAGRSPVVTRLEYLASNARASGEHRAAEALEQAAYATAEALAKAAAQESMRDRMAKAALPGVMAWPAEYLPNPGHAAMAEAAYHIADAMMAAREKLQ